ncbi:ABC transporter permease [Actinophytocola xinjiangensis]|uniref:ABC transporter permease n=1 Tax=Actinophytocola xinjiangensis TaxID=485602 RepID=A0A7Z1AVA2_9PSEU|nr:ABC transporter permease [Actinophytocola xinjiangensis]OLF06530.1 ABC transporter permease [Actinophytocola xinjiangensis]
MNIDWPWPWLERNLDDIAEATGQHLYLALLPVLVGLVISVPLGWAASRWRLARGILVPLAGVLYTIPSLALITLVPLALGTKIIDPLNVQVPLAIYTIALLVRSVSDALRAVPGDVIAAATAIGYRPVRQFLSVELPLAVPVIIAGLRVAVVSAMSLTAVGALVGIGGLGQLITEGFLRNNGVELVVAIVLIVVIALLIDALLLLAGRVITPWTRAGRGVKA